MLNNLQKAGCPECGEKFMIYRYIMVLLLFCFKAVNAQDTNSYDPEVVEFSNYMFEVSYLDGMFDGVVDYCKQHVSENVIKRSEQDWEKLNGVYIDAISDALSLLVATKVTKDRQDYVLKEMTKNIKGWYDDSFHNNHVLDQIKKSNNKRLSCTKNLGSMNSSVFDLKNMIPERFEFWERMLKK